LIYKNKLSLIYQPSLRSSFMFTKNKIPRNSESFKVLPQTTNLFNQVLNSIVFILAVMASTSSLAYTREKHPKKPKPPSVTPEACVDKPITITPQLVADGHRLFKKETFSGNGRTCETCHRENNNFTIDPDFIATLSPKDPLFVAEQKPALRNLENSFLLRQFGLICENVDGLDKNCVFRSVPHTLGLSQTIALGITDSASGKPVHETGWAGDGAPGDGSLRCFALGAIVQHFPKTLERKPGKDFRLPTDYELDAMLAFQLSLGRQTTPTVSTLTFADSRAQEGKNLFFGPIPTRGGTGNCAFCHTEAGANNSTNFGRRNLAINTNLSANAPACVAQQAGLLPSSLADGGFGKTGSFNTIINCVAGPVNATFFGDTVGNGRNFFNVPSLHEAADTGPFFHNNAADTLEEAIAFYTTDEFNNGFPPGRAFVFKPGDVDKLSIFLRALNGHPSFPS
jgi:cytochrome c peroxidase